MARDSTRITGGAKARRIGEPGDDAFDRDTSWGLVRAPLICDAPDGCVGCLTVVVTTV